MIESIRIQNYKALRDVTLKLTPIHVLIGKNDSGKTSILEAITAICRSVDFDLTSSFQGRWFGRELVSKWATDPIVGITADIRLEGDLIRYMLEVAFLPDQKQAVVETELIHVIGDEFNLTSRGDTLSGVHRSTRRRTEGIHFFRASQIRDSVSSVRTCRWSGKMLGLPVAFEGEDRPFDRSDSGFGLALSLDDILGDNRDRFVTLERQFQTIFPQVRAIKLVREAGYKLPPNDRENVPVLQPGSGKGIRFDFDNGMTDVPASQVSDGVLIVLAYLATLFSPRPPRMLLIEEPENGIHPERLVEVIRLVRETQQQHPNTQIVMTTHSPYLISHFTPEEVTLCHKGSDGTVSLHRLSDSKEVERQASIFTLGEIWTGEGDDALAKSTAVTTPTQEATP